MSRVTNNFFLCLMITGLASEALVSGKLLWKTRPKYHKLLDKTFYVEYTVLEQFYDGVVFFLIIARMCFESTA